MSPTLINSNQAIAITKEDIFHHVQLSCKIPEMVEKIVERKIIISAAEKAGIEITKEELQKASDKMRVLSKLRDAQATWTWLEKHSLALDDFEQIVYSTILAGKLANHLFADKIEPYFYEHQLDYAGAVICEMVLDDEDEAIELYFEIQKGEISFFNAAQQHIEDIELRRKGGYKGKVARADMKPEVSAAVFAAASPQLLKPIITANGIYLILVEEIIQPELDQKLRGKIMLDLHSEWIKQQVQQVRVVNHF